MSPHGDALVASHSACLASRFIPRKATMSSSTGCGQGYVAGRPGLLHGIYKAELDEMEYVTGMIRRIAAILMLGGKLNANYVAVKADAFAVG